MYMSIVTLARKTRAQRAMSIRSGWTLATTKGGKCCGPANGGEPLIQQSFRQYQTKKTNFIWKPIADKTAAEHMKAKKLTAIQSKCDLSHNLINGKIHKSNNCTSDACTCNCNREGACCNIFKETNIPQASDYLAHHIKHRASTASTCGQHKHKSKKPKQCCSCKNK